jgi:biotin transport system substrate-specific component
MIHVPSRVRARELTRREALAASLIGAALTAVCAQIAFYLPGNPVPVTMQVFAVLGCGLVLGGRLGALSQIEYLLAGAVGLPVFAGFKGGYVALAGPTGGYLVGFVLAALVVGSISEKMHRRTFAGLLAACLLGVAAIYLLGRAWFAVWLGDVTGTRSWLLGVAPFVGLDAAKAALAAVLWGGKRS